MKNQKLLLGEYLRQEFFTERWVAIPEGFMELYLGAGRPRPHLLKIVYPRWEVLFNKRVRDGKG